MLFKNINIDGLNIFYREAGNETASKLVLLHGFPASSHQYRNLMPALADRFHVIAPDYPGFGNSDMPDPAKFAYTFDKTSEIIESFLRKVGFTVFGLYVQDYGGPVGFRSSIGIPSGSNGSSFRTPMPTRSALRRHGTSFAAITGKPAARSRKRQLARFSSPRRSRSSTPRGIPIRS
ncbi:MAG: alpha/beta fold hydrolase [Xanthobacteraceae bacterium]